jgi:hypothetical protein
MTATQPNIEYPIRVLRQYNQNRRNEDMVALNGSFQYISGMKYWFQRFGGEGAGEDANRCSVGFDYAGCPDEYKETGGLVITFREVVN